MLSVQRLPLTALLLLAFATCGAAAAPQAKPIVYFGVNLRYDPISMYEHYQPMMDYLTRSTPYEFRLKISSDYEEGIQHLVGGKSQICSLGDGAVLEAILKHKAVPLVKPLNAHGKPLYRSVFIVSNKSPLRSLRDLKGKKIAMGYFHSTTGNLLPRHMLIATLGKNGPASVVNLAKHTSVAKAVIKGEYDAGALKDVVAYQYASRGLRVIASSQEYPSTPLVAGPRVSPAIVRAVTEALVKLDPARPEHRLILDRWDEEYRHGFARVEGSEYTAMAKLYRSIPYGCGTGCHKR